MKDLDDLLLCTTNSQKYELPVPPSTRNGNSSCWPLKRNACCRLSLTFLRCTFFKGAPFGHRLQISEARIKFQFPHAFPTLRNLGRSAKILFQVYTAICKFSRRPKPLWGLTASVFSPKNPKHLRLLVGTLENDNFHGTSAPHIYRSMNG